MSAPAYAVTFTSSIATWQAVAGSWNEDQEYGDEFTDISSVLLDAGPYLNFVGDVEIRTVGSGWATWCCSYTGDVLYTQGATSVDVEINPSVSGFGFYAEPNPFAEYLITLELADGSGLQQLVQGSSGASFFGWNGPGVTKFTISSSVDFAFGDFFYYGAVPEPATWAMMISGFGLVGGAMRRARATKVGYSVA
ncbi:PEPxxWA-CTERM sorting domain-containing protein [Sphingomonas sp. DBB INV C78]|uniref:PEPxxWA-CTERM sorting domain-containing protein n=1 Tax=Sphingomonas sp. DBB INV C78 TaxID=3349434 RepID=UPI0036D3C2C6